MRVERAARIDATFAAPIELRKRPALPRSNELVGIRFEIGSADN